MPVVSENCLKGNYGAAVVMARLSSECLVRPVAVDTDVGVDLYCETVSDRQPFLHFWLQVKAGGQCKPDGDTKTASCSFERSKLEYWFRQPVPVFAALVPTEWPVHGEPDVYVVDIGKYLLFNPLQPGTHSATLTSDYRWGAGKRAEVQQFLRDVVPAATARIRCREGVVAPVPTIARQYVYQAPHVPVMRFKDEILQQLRTTAAFSILFALRSEPGSDGAKELAGRLARIVGQFDDDPHYENYLSRGMSAHANGDYVSAAELYEKACRCIEADPVVRDDESWQRIASCIKGLEQSARAGKDLRSALPPENEGQRG